MKLTLDQSQCGLRNEYRSFAQQYVYPLAKIHDETQTISIDLIRKMSSQNYLAPFLPKEHGGLGLDMVSFGLLNEEIGRGCFSLRSLITVQSMVAIAIFRWGTDIQKEKWLFKLARGEIIGALGLTEPSCGSDAKHIETIAENKGSHFVLTGKKKWITMGQLADVCLIFAKCEGKSAAFLVETHRAGFSRKPMENLMGARASYLAELNLDHCVIPAENLVGRAGFGFSHVMSTALDIGRYSVAWGAVGLSQASLDAGLQYSDQRVAFDMPIKNHQLIQRLIANMETETTAARLLCYQAGMLKDKNETDAISATLLAKYYSAKTAFRSANAAVQIHGANSFSPEYPVGRYWRDAKILEIIEGSNEILQQAIAKNSYRLSNE